MKRDVSIESMNELLFGVENEGSGTIKDPIFGTLHNAISSSYNGYLDIDWWPGKKSIKLTTRIHNGKVDIDAHLAYIDYIHDEHGIDNLLKIGIPKLITMIKQQGDYGDTEPTVSNFHKLVDLTTILFLGGGHSEWGIIFESPMAEEHGFCIYSTDRTIKVGDANDML